MTSPSLSQQEYLKGLKRHRQFVTNARILLFVAFILIWELSARFGLIDSFIFSSPARIASTFISMVKDGSIFLHVGMTLAETLLL